MTNPSTDWGEELKKTKLFREGGSCFEACDYEEICADMKFFIQAMRASLLREIEEGVEKYQNSIEGSDDYQSGKIRACDEIVSLIRSHMKE